MSGLARKQKRTEARRGYDRFTRMWRDEMRLVGLYGKKSKYKRPTFSQWYAEHEHEFGNPPNVVVPSQYDEGVMREYLGEDPWADQLDEKVTAPAEPTEERGVTTIQIVGDEEA